MTPEPMIKLQSNGKAAVLSYNVPEPTSYSGQNVIELGVPRNYFKGKATKRPSKEMRPDLSKMDESLLKSSVKESLKTGLGDRRYFPNAMLRSGELKFVEKTNPGLVVKEGQYISKKLQGLDESTITARMQNGDLFNLYKNMFGTYSYNFIPQPVEPRPRIMLLETYRLSSFLGNYGAGRTLKTFSLLPGEDSKITVKSYTKSASSSKEASSILDSFTEESADEFESAIRDEQSDKKKYDETFAYHAEAEAKCSWGFGSAKVSGGVKGSTASSREEFAKNVSTASEKHAMKSSAKRNIEINTSYETKEESGEEVFTERMIKNVNMSRTLNFVFRQMNQEFISLLHLTDVRVAFFNGYSESYMEVPLYELDDLLDEVIVGAYKNKIRQQIVDELKLIYDYQSKPQEFISEEALMDGDDVAIPNSEYLRVKKDYVSTYEDAATGSQIKVPGIILNAQKLTLRTEGIIVEALLGQGEALDEYSRKLQLEAVQEKDYRNDLIKTEIEKNRLLMEIIRENDEEKSAIAEHFYHPSDTTVSELVKSFMLREPEENVT